MEFSQIEQSMIVYFEWEPSQNGLSFVFLQLHKKTSLLSIASNLTGVLPASLCEPSQKGWDRESRARWYEPDSEGCCV